jgi:bacterial/archaeal transporter family protein
MTWLFWAILSAVFAAATALLAKVGVSGIDSNLATAIRTSVVLVFAWAIAIGFEKHRAITQIEPRSWLFLSLSGVCTGLSWLCYFRALQMGPASSVAPVDKLSVVLVILGAWFILRRATNSHEDRRRIADHNWRGHSCVCLAIAEQTQQV